MFGWRRATLSKSARAELKFVGLAALLTLALLEVALRMYNPVQPKRYFEGGTPANMRARLVNIPGMPPESGYQSTNALGFRGPMPPSDVAARLSLVAIGASSTQSPVVPDGRDWPLLTGTLLKENFAPLWMNNAGISGLSLKGDRELLQRVLDYPRPKVGLFLVGANAILEEEQAGAKGAKARTMFRTSMKALFDHSVLFATLRELKVRNTMSSQIDGASFNENDLQREIPTGAPRSPAEIEKLLTSFAPARRDYRFQLEQLLDTAAKRGMYSVVITQPVLAGTGQSTDHRVNLERIWVRFAGIGLDGRSAWPLVESFNEVTRQVAAERGIPLIDLARTLPKDSRYYYDTIHFTVAGSAAAAHVIAANLCPVLARQFPRYASRPCLENGAGTGKLRGNKAAFVRVQ